MVLNALHGDPLPVYGDGQQVRNWIFVEDFARGIGHVLAHGEPGETYNVGGPDEAVNLDVVRRIIALTGASEDLIDYVTDRPGHDRRYSLGSEKVRALGWEARVRFDEGLERTVAWYQDNRAWWETIRSGDYRAYYERQYGASCAAGDVAPALTRHSRARSAPVRRPRARTRSRARAPRRWSRPLTFAVAVVAGDRDVLDVEVEVVGVLDRLVHLLLAARAGLLDLLAQLLGSTSSQITPASPRLARALELLDDLGDLLLLALEVAGGGRGAASGGERGEHEQDGEACAGHAAPRG